MPNQFSFFFSLCSICFDPSIIRRDLFLFLPKPEKGGICFCLPKPEKGGICFCLPKPEKDFIRNRNEGECYVMNHFYVLSVNVDILKYNLTHGSIAICHM